MASSWQVAGPISTRLTRRSPNRCTATWRADGDQPTWRESTQLRRSSRRKVGRSDSLGRTSMPRMLHTNHRQRLCNRLCLFLCRKGFCEIVMLLTLTVMLATVYATVCNYSPRFVFLSRGRHNQHTCFAPSIFSIASFFILLTISFFAVSNQNKKQNRTNST